MNTRILLFSPIHQRESLLPYYLKHIYNLTYPKHLLSIYFIVNNSTDNSYEILKQFKSQHEHEYEYIKIEVFNDPNKPKFASKQKDSRTTEKRNNYSYTWLSTLRNMGMKECVKNRQDYIFSCDSDILISSNTLERLLDNGKDYCAGLIYNGYVYRPPNTDVNYDTVSFAYKYPNVLKDCGNGKYSHIVNYKVKNPHKMPIGTLIETQFTGAIFLAKREVAQVMKYEAHNLGEDLPASLSAIKAGYQLYCDVSLFSVHCMSVEILELFLHKELKFNDGTIVELQ